MSKNVIILLTPGFPRDESDTTCLPAFQQFALSLNKLYPQFKLIVISFHYPFIEKEYIWKRIQVYSLGGKNRKNVYRLFLSFRVNSLLKKLSQQFSIKGIISLWLTECAYIGEKFSKKKAIPHVIWIIGQDAKPGNKFVHQIDPAPKKLVAMSDFLKEELFRNYSINAGHVIENGISESIFSPLNSSARPIDIFGAGSLIPLKNYSLFIRLIAELKNEFPDLKAQIAGVGEEFDKLKEMIRKSGLENNVSLLGERSHSQTLGLMNQSKLFLHTSLYEGNSTVLMEALYSGCHVVSTQPLSLRATENLYVEKDTEKLKAVLVDLLSKKSPEAKRVVFNTMDESAHKMMNVLLNAN